MKLRQKCCQYNCIVGNVLCEEKFIFGAHNVLQCKKGLCLITHIACMHTCRPSVYTQNRIELSKFQPASHSVLCYSRLSLNTFWDDRQRYSPLGLCHTSIIIVRPSVSKPTVIDVFRVILVNPDKNRVQTFKLFQRFNRIRE